MQIYADDTPGRTDLLCSDLKPATRPGAEIHDAVTPTKQPVTLR